MSKQRTYFIIAVVAVVGVGMVTYSLVTPRSSEPIPITSTADLITAAPEEEAIPPTEQPPPTSSPYPTGTPEGWELTVTPTRIAGESEMEGTVLVVIDPEATDGVRVRSGPGYECEDDPDCNWTGSLFPSIGNVTDIYVIDEVDDSHDLAWCHYSRDPFTEEGGWSACTYLRPAGTADCQIAEELGYAEVLAACE